MKVGIIGSRQGAALDDVLTFCAALHRKYPEAVVVSGGARGVDQTAEQEWLRLGGRVISLRPKKVSEESYVIERWMLDGGLAAGSEQRIVAENSSDGGRAQKPTEGNSRTPFLISTGPAASPRIDILDVPTWGNYESAAWYRDFLIAEMSDRIISFQKKGGSRGSALTCGYGRDKDKPVLTYYPEQGKRFAA